MRVAVIYFLVAFGFSCILLYPGVWLPDSLNAFIQQKTGVFGAAQPPLLGLLCRVSSKISSTTIPLFLAFNFCYFGGLAWLVFAKVKSKFLAPATYFVLAFFPMVFAALGVVQTETLQIACLTLFVPLTFYSGNATGYKKYATAFFSLLLLVLFVLARYESLVISVPLSYLLVFSLGKKHGIRTLTIATALAVIMQLMAFGLLKLAGIDNRLKTEMQLTLLVTDLAAISVESNQNFVPDYCWQNYLPQNERTVENIAKGYYDYRWKGAFYSYTYNVDPMVGLFKHNIYDNKTALYATWFSVVSRHLHYYLWYHTKLFVYLITNDYFEMGLWGGIKDAGEVKSKLVVEDTVAAKAFVQNNSSRFYLLNNTIFFKDNNSPITESEVQQLKNLVAERRAGDVVWMKWYSNIPTSVYTGKNMLAEKVLLPLFGFMRVWFRFFCTQAPYLLLLVSMFVYAWLKLQHTENRFYILLLCGCGILHVAMRFVFLTDNVFRFGLLMLMFLLLAVPLLLAEILKKNE